MRTIFAAIALVLTGWATADAQGYDWTRDYTKKDGTYVPGHYQTNPNGTINDNWSTKGNYNPFTGKPGTVDPNRYQPYTPYTPYTPQK